jgi:hypothetical protein
VPHNSRGGGADDGRAAEREGGNLSALSEVDPRVDPIMVGQRPLAEVAGLFVGLLLRTHRCALPPHDRPHTTLHHSPARPSPRPSQRDVPADHSSCAFPCGQGHLYATTSRGLASASAEPLHAQLEQIFLRIRISSCSSRAWRLRATKGAPESAQRDGRAGPAFVCVRCTVRRVGGARLISPRT